MSVTLFTLAAAAVPVALRAIGDFAKQNKGTFNAILKQSKPVINDVSKKLDETIRHEVKKYEDNGWDKE